MMIMTNIFASTVKRIFGRRCGGGGSLCQKSCTWIRMRIMQQGNIELGYAVYLRCNSLLDILECLKQNSG